MPKPNANNRFYRDGPDWPQTPQQKAAERTYRVGFLAAAREAASWLAPDENSLAKAWAERRKARKAAATRSVRETAPSRR